MSRIQVPGTEGAQQPTAASGVPTQPPTSPQVPSGTVPPGVPPPGQVPPPVESSTSQGKTIAVILTLLFVYPLGVILMYILTKWKWWVKLLLTLPMVLFLVGVAAAAVMIAINPEAQIQKAECVAKCQESSDVQGCVAQCIEMPVTSITPEPVVDEGMYGEIEPTIEGSVMEEPVVTPSEDEMMSY